MAKVTILGGGAWGSALATLAQNKQNQVRVWSRKSADTLECLLSDTEIIISAVSMKGVVSLVEKIKELSLHPDVILVTATKGLDPVTTSTPSVLWQKAFPYNPVVVLSGPNLSQEIEKGLPAATVAASVNINAAQRIQEVLSSDRFRVYINTDPLGTELGGTLKNVFAIAAGVCDGLQLGTNAKSALLTRALPEMMRVGTTLGGHIETFYGLSGLGDLLTTCNSPLSRNYRVGEGLAQGKSLEQVLEDLQSTAEGVNTTNVLMEIANRQNIEVPIAYQVYRLLNGKISPQQAVTALMERTLKPESL
jgi:glycerol-3-phosphate dehydrogenase (NAD(P)+)